MKRESLMIRLKGEEHAKLVSQSLFALGYSWNGNGNKLVHLDAVWFTAVSYPFRGTVGAIGTTANLLFYWTVPGATNFPSDYAPYREVTLEDLLDMEKAKEGPPKTVVSTTTKGNEFAPPAPKPKFLERKYRVFNLFHHEQLRRELVKLGYDILLCTNYDSRPIAALYAHKSGRVTHDHDGAGFEEFFNDHRFTEGSLSTLGYRTKGITDSSRASESDRFEPAQPNPVPYDGFRFERLGVDKGGTPMSEASYNVKVLVEKLTDAKEAHVAAIADGQKEAKAQVLEAANRFLKSGGSKNVQTKEKVLVAQAAVGVEDYELALEELSLLAGESVGAMALSCNVRDLLAQAGKVERRKIYVSVIAG